MTFDTIKPLYLSQHQIDISINDDTNADFIAFEVIVNNQMIGTRLHVPKSDDKAAIDVQHMIHAELIEREASIVVLSEATRVRQPVVCQIRAATILNGVTGTFTNSPTFKVMLGYEHGLHSPTWYNNFSDSKAFLTDFPNREKVTIEQYQFLTYFHHTTITNGQIAVNANGYYSDGTALNNTTIVSSLNLYDCLVINANAAKLGLSTTGLMRYEVYVKFIQDSTIDAVEFRLSEIWEYQIHTVSEHFKDILFFNDYFAPQIIRLTGDWSNEFNTDYQRISKETGIDQQTIDSNDIFFGKSGFIGKEVSKAMKHLYRRGKCFLLENDTAQLLVLDQNKWQIESSFKFLYFLNLAMTAASKPVSTTNKALFENAVIDL